MTLHLPPALAVAMIEHALVDHPIEACGLLVGPRGQPLQLFRMTNVLASTSRFAFDVDEQLRLYAQLDARGWDIGVIYHSHSTGSAIPSRVDRAYAQEGVSYLIVATEPDEPELRSWRLVDGAFAEEAIEILDEPAA